jgi:hypothetical protein
MEERTVMSEFAYRFGRARHLIGVAGLPGRVAGNVGVIVLNAGLVHRIGPFRLHVEMTRRLNACGYPTLRFDLSTLGDSSASDESQSHKQRVCADIADAMTLLGNQSGCTRFVLIGLCSGAENAHLVASSDPRVAGAVFLDGYAYRTIGYKLRHYLPRLLNPARAMRFFMRRRRAGTQPSGPAFGVQFPPRARVRSDLADMLERGLKLCFIYSGGASKYFNHQGQFRACFGRVAAHPDVSVSYLKEADHTYILAADRARLLDIIEGWLTRKFFVEPKNPIT